MAEVEAHRYYRCPPNSEEGGYVLKSDVDAISTAVVKVVETSGPTIEYYCSTVGTAVHRVDESIVKRAVAGADTCEECEDGPD